MKQNTIGRDSPNQENPNQNYLPTIRMLSFDSDLTYIVMNSSSERMVNE